MTQAEISVMIADLRFRVADTWSETVSVPKDVLRKAAILIKALAAPPDGRDQAFHSARLRSIEL